jgi:hypothetical protein
VKLPSSVGHPFEVVFGAWAFIRQAIGGNSEMRRSGEVKIKSARSASVKKERPHSKYLGDLGVEASETCTYAFLLQKFEGRGI